MNINNNQPVICCPLTAPALRLRRLAKKQQGRQQQHNISTIPSTMDPTIIPTIIFTILKIYIVDIKVL